MSREEDFFTGQRGRCLDVLPGGGCRKSEKNGNRNLHVDFHPVKQYDSSSLFLLRDHLQEKE